MTVHDVLIAGGGPVGMAAALLLARAGTRSVVLEAARERQAIGSKAICFQRDALDVLDRIGVAKGAIAEGVTWSVARTFYRDTEIIVRELPASPDGTVPPFINLSQSHLEDALHARVATDPLIEYRLDSPVTAIDEGTADDAERVAVRVGGTDGPTTLRGRFLLGCDGARSTVREQIGATFDGHSFDEQFLIADIEADLPFPAERRFYFDPPWNPGRQVLVHQQPRSVWRIDWQVPSDFDLEAERASGGLDRRIRQITEDAEYRLDWVSAYRFHQRNADPWRRGRVFLAGDAAHLMSPFGARGLNSGLQDAENVAWKVVAALRGEAGPALLDSYQLERRSAATENLRVTGETMRFLVPRNPEDRARRVRLLAAAAEGDGAARARVDSGKLAEPFWYLESPLTTPLPGPVAFPTEPGADRPPVPGTLCPDAPVEDGRLRQRFGPGFTLLAFASGGAAAAMAAAGRVAGVRVERFPRDSAVAEALDADPDDVVVVRPDGHLAARVGPDGVGPALLRALGHG